MCKIQEILKIINNLENDQEYLEGGNFSEIIYPLQKLDYEDWENLQNQIMTMTSLQHMILVDGILEIGDNKVSNYDTSKIFAQVLVLSEQIDTEVLIQYLDFLDNRIPKQIELVNQIFEKIKWLENQNKNYEIDFDSKYRLIDKLYVDALC